MQFQLGLSGASLRALTVENNDFSVSWEGLEFEASLLDVLVHKKLSIEALTVDQLVVDFSRVHDWAAFKRSISGPSKQVNPLSVCFRNCKSCHSLSLIKSMQPSP